MCYDLGMTKDTLAEFHRDLVSKQHAFTNDTELGKRQRRIIEFSNSFISQDDTICDVGCHDGRILAHLPGRRKVGVDFYTSRFDEVRQKGIYPVKHNIDSSQPFPFEDGSFDVVTCYDTLEHCTRTDHIVNEISRMLKPKGLFISSVPNTNHPGAIVYFMMDYPPPSACRYRNNHYRDFTNLTFYKMLEVHGFKILKNEGSYLMAGLGRMGVLLAKLKPRLGETLMFVGQKVRSSTIADGCTSTRKELEQFFLDPF